nr:reverse transcriptase domain-containing protein [Tanacetum cinerariifolium]
MREVYYHDWLSNPVMVKKSDGSWRMCVDFTDLNKACPQDCYLLPEIDWKVESLCGYPFKCFLDAYKGYHQIQMAKEDEEKTAFHTSQGVYCYTKMPFGLKNAGATYQRLVDSAFEGQVSRNLEVYIDDLVIKSHTKDELVRDIEETFRTLRKINMKLNPKKCTFGATEGMGLCVFTLEWAISSLPNGIDSNPDIYPPLLKDPLLIRDPLFDPRPNWKVFRIMPGEKRPRLLTPTPTPFGSSDSNSSSHQGEEIDPTNNFILTPFPTSINFHQSNKESHRNASKP